MKIINIHTASKTILSDIITPISLYLKIRDKYCNSFLLESSDYHGNDNNYSFICFEPLVNFKVENEIISVDGLGLEKQTDIKERGQVITELKSLLNQFKLSDNDSTNGFFGYSNYDSVRYFEKIDIELKKEKPHSTPDIHYCFFKYIIEIDHYKNTLKIKENLRDNEESKIENISQLVGNQVNATHNFKTVGVEQTNISDTDFKQLITKGKEHCQKGDVFQVVFSRQFSQQFKGDEFNVYRALRSVNPSPYLFYFDYGNYRLFGSSPEAQIKVKEKKATINPIAGTFKRTGNDLQDEEAAKQLIKDPKENAEHTMLVDLARNDLSKHGQNINIKTYKEVHFYSHVIHLVSEVEADIQSDKDVLNIYADTFPAGTLSGAPKYRAMELINKYENQNRGFYGGAIGFLGFDGSINHAITIRSFLSKNNTLFFQAGAGVVVDSDEESELQEVNNKLRALKQALTLAENIAPLSSPLREENN